jgi:hypothetical protein
MNGQVAEADTGNPMMRAAGLTRNNEGKVVSFDHFKEGLARRVLQGRARPRQVYVRAINGASEGRRAWVGLRALAFCRTMAGGCGVPSIFGHIWVARKASRPKARVPKAATCRSR